MFPSNNSPSDDVYIGVEEVAVELNLSHRGAWELVKRIGVPMLNGDRKMSQARFRRSAWVKARDAAEKPATPRLPARPSYMKATALDQSKPTATSEPKIDKLARLRNLKI